MCALNYRAPNVEYHFREPFGSRDVREDFPMSGRTKVTCGSLACSSKRCLKHRKDFGAGVLPKCSPSPTYLRTEGKEPQEHRAARFAGSKMEGSLQKCTEDHRGMLPCKVSPRKTEHINSRISAMRQRARPRGHFVKSFAVFFRSCNRNSRGDAFHPGGRMWPPS